MHRPVSKDLTSNHRKQLLKQVNHLSGRFVTIYRDRWTDKIAVSRFETLSVAHNHI